MSGAPLQLNLGCGRRNAPTSYGIDILDVAGVDVVCDLLEGIPLPDNSFDTILAIDFLEHTPQGVANIRIMEEIYRVLKVGGTFYFSVPSTDGNNVGAFQDPTHLSFWNIMKFHYFMADKYGQGFRSLYDIKSFFAPVNIYTINNAAGITYVEGSLTKEALND